MEVPRFCKAPGLRVEEFRVEGEGFRGLGLWGFRALGV